LHLKSINMSIRTEKISKLILKELGIIFQQAGREFYPGVMITVTKVRVSNDLSTAKIYLSFFPTQKTEETLNHINENKKYFRHSLAQKIKNQVKAIPEVSFFIDDSLDYIEQIENLLKE